MAKKESSFDCVSQIDMQEVDNACTQAARELSQRYDLKGTNSQLTLNKGEGEIVIEAPSEFNCRQIVDILNGKLIKRGVEPTVCGWQDPKPSAGARCRMSAKLKEGIDKELAKRIAKDIRDTKLKVKATIEGDKLRVSGASKDELQEVIAFLRDKDYGQPLQFTNYR